MVKDAAIAALGAALGPTYTGLKKFKSGGMAQLYSAHDELLNRDLVIKVLGRPVEDLTTATKRFSQEAQIVAALNHPNIVPIYFAGEFSLDAAPQFFFAMKKIDGPSLDFLSALDLQETIRIVRELAWALDHAHSAGIYHRDIKPANICLDAHTKKPILLDFGIAAISGRSGLTAEGKFLGTLNYMSPEQFDREKKVDARVDVYALGEVAYRLIAGHDPFLADTGFDLLDEKRNWSKQKLIRAVPKITHQLAELVDRCLTFEPADRYQTAAALGRDLDSMMPHISFPALLSSITSGEVSAPVWSKIGVEAGLPAPFTKDVHLLGVYILQNWLEELGFISIQQLRERLDALQPTAVSLVREFAQSCQTDDRPYAVGVDVIRIVLGIEHNAPLEFPQLLIPENSLTRQLNRFQRGRSDAASKLPERLAAVPGKS